MLGSYSEGQLGALNRVQKRAAKFVNNINKSVSENLAQRRFVARICTFFKAYNGGRAWKAIRNRILKPFYLNKEDRNRKIRTSKQRTDVGKYSFINRTIQCWNQLPGGLLSSFPCKINTFRKMVKNIVTSE